MTELSFTSPAPGTGAFQQGGQKDITKIVQAFNDIKTFLKQSGWVDDAYLASPNNAAYKTILSSVTSENPSGGTYTTGSTYLLIEGAGSPILPTAVTAGQAAIYLDPADYAVAGRTTKYRLRVSLLTNTTAPTSTFTVGFYPVSAVAGASGSNTVTLGAVTAGSTVAFVAPGANTISQGNSGDFTAPAAGLYVVAVAITVANSAVNSSVALRGVLQVRQV